MGLGDGLPVAVGVRPGRQVLVDGQVSEDAPSLEDLRDAGPYPRRWTEVVDGLAVEAHRAFRDLALVDVEQAPDSPQRGRLAGPVGSEERHDLAVRHLDGQAAQDEDHLVVDDLQVCDFEHARSSCGPAGQEMEKGAAGEPAAPLTRRRLSAAGFR